MSREQARGRAAQSPDEGLEHASGTAAPGADDAAVRSVDRAAALLVCLADADGSASVTDLSHSLDLHKSTVSRLLSTLERRGLVEQDRESGHFRLGVGIIRLAQSAERTLDLRAIALPEMEALAKATHETVSLEVFDGVAAAVAICQIDGPNLTPMPDITGRPVFGSMTAPTSDIIRPVRSWPVRGSRYAPCRKSSRDLPVAASALSIIGC
jgi:DNA-binding transcriptional ArsR family regulator